MREFTETVVYSHLFEHFVLRKNAPEEIHRIKSKLKFDLNFNNTVLAGVL